MIETNLVWPDLAKFHIFFKSFWAFIKYLAKFCTYFGKKYAIGQISILVNAQLLNELSSHLVTLEAIEKKFHSTILKIEFLILTDSTLGVAQRRRRRIEKIFQLIFDFSSTLGNISSPLFLHVYHSLSPSVPPKIWPLKE